MKTTKTILIRNTYEKIMEKLRIHDSNRKILEGELAALQCRCQHINAEYKTWVDYEGRTTTVSCPDCGYKRI